MTRDLQLLVLGGVFGVLTGLPAGMWLERRSASEVKPAPSAEACETLGNIAAITRRLEMHEDFMRRMAQEKRR
jgi:hypothetical protein